MTQLKLSELSYQVFDKIDAWQVLMDSYDEEELILKPATKNTLGQIKDTIGEVWCLCKAVFNNGNEYKASAMCRADSNEGPLLWTVWNGKENVSLILPPAPDFVLAEEGPIPFCAKFGQSQDSVFPIKFIVIPKFQFQPYERSTTIKI
jgi:hypothetical protein